MKFALRLRSSGKPIMGMVRLRTLLGGSGNRLARLDRLDK